MIEKQIEIKEFYDLINLDGGTYEVKTPDGFKMIGDVYKKNNKQLFSIILENGMFLGGSKDHLVEIDTRKNTDDEININIEIIDNSTWLRLEFLTKNDFVKTIDGSFLPSEINKLEIGTTYDLEVLDKKHRYISNGIISHNTGKSAIVEGLALMIVAGTAPTNLLDKEILSLEMGSLVAGTKYRGQFEERMKKIIDELKQDDSIIIFMDEIHTLVGAGGSSGALDAANILKPELARGGIQCIGATTFDEYKNSIEKDGALERRFQKVIIDEPTEEETRVILDIIKGNYEKHHKVTYTSDALDACVKMAARFISDRAFPDKAIDILDEAGSRTQIKKALPTEIAEYIELINEYSKKKIDAVAEQEYGEAAKCRDLEQKTREKLDTFRAEWDKEQEASFEEIGVDDIRSIISMISKIPLDKISSDDREKYIHLEKILKDRIIGQDEVLAIVAKTLRRNKTAISNPNKPIGTFLFTGGTGCGKCICGDTEVTVRNKKTGKVEKIDINSFIYQYKQ